MNHLLDGLDVTPKNSDDLEIIIDKTNEGNNVSLNLTQLIFVNEAKKKIEEYISSNGYFKGIPYQIKLDNGFVMEYFLDQTDNYKIQDYQVEIAVKKRFDNLAFWENADSASFDSLGNAWGVESLTIGRVVITTDAHLELLALLANLMTIAKSIMDRLYDIANLSAAAGGVGTWIYALIMIAALTSKLIVLLSEIQNFIQKIEEYVNPEVEIFPVMSIKSILTEYLFNIGKIVEQNDFMDYFADIIYVGTTYKYQQQNYGYYSGGTIENRIPVGYPTTYDYFKEAKYDFTSVGGFVRWFLQAFNAKIKIIDDYNVAFYRRDYVDGVVNNITTGLTIQSSRVNEETPNTNEAWKRCLVKYNLDASDNYTSFVYEDSLSEFSTENGVDAYTGLNLLKGIKLVDMMFAQGFAYNGVNVPHWDFIQKVSNTLSGVISTSSFTTYLSGNAPYSGILVTNKYTYDMPKLVVKIGDKTIRNLTAREVFKEFHEIDFLPNNSWMIHTSEFFECNDDIFVNLYNNDYAEINGEVCQVLRVSYKPSTKKASLIYKKPSNYANDLNLKEIL